LKLFRRINQETPKALYQRVLLVFNYYFCGIAIFTFVGLVRITYINSEYKEMHISITDDLKKQFHATCVMRGKKMSQVVTRANRAMARKQRGSPTWGDKEAIGTSPN
jgi:hypothetical protein